MKKQDLRRPKKKSGNKAEWERRLWYKRLGIDYNLRQWK